ncbi:Na+/H+ antiporter subunit E [Streptomyces ruber]|uniref:Na+/H+ antiporter subunit E n=2 Tax=Streptomyces TaxID=1883 RepID=A0A918BS80_9ACTN|nr:Na+/H+ antiporter subunit E [Streptomyces ruber]GGQ87900.1 Na+/H+ antiporter subunit E [Streptomyces ruber]
MTRTDGLPNRRGHGRARRVFPHLPMVAWLWLLWLLLWGSTSALVLTGGLLVAVAVVLAFRLPAVRPGTVPRPLGVVRLLIHLLTDLVTSALTVAWQVVRHGGRTTSAIIEVPLDVDGDLLITAVAELTNVGPGNLVTEIDRRRRRLYVHALPAGGPQDIARRRSEVKAVERRVVQALGRRSEDTGGDTGGEADDRGRNP